MPKDYNALFKADSLAFMKKYSCIPENQIGGTGDTVGALNSKDQLKAKAKGGTTQASYEYKSMGPTRMVGYLNFTKIAHADPTIGMRGQIDVRGSYTPDATKVEAHYLPWLDQAIISLTIPPMPLYGGGTKYFFTASINGCSVFIKGPPTNPTVYHAGGNTYRSDPKQGAKFWRDMMKTRADTKAGKIVAEVNKTMYVTDKKDKMLGTANSRLFEQWMTMNPALITSNPNGITIMDVAPTACVFGRREAGLWTFYLQENVSIFYTSLGADGITRTQCVVRPMQLREVYPNGGGNAMVAPGMSRLLKA